ncbi:Uncharacterised protein [Kingella potus]|uniref:Uncharacterized protein n=1 Tax=Kingella potus TaxID=265175 RepID=A0A377QYK7_9NEIS|nr:sugar ABC transporter permease [Kingella potus]STR00323.1 Uncharacterised protein [Kingella potus]
MAKLSGSLFKKNTPFDQTSAAKKAARPGSAAASAALLCGILAFAVLPVLNIAGLSGLLPGLGVPAYVLPAVFAVLAVVLGFKGQGGAALAGLILGFACLLLAGVCAAVTQYAPQFNHIVQPVYKLAGLEEPVAVSPVTGNPAPQIEQKPAPAADSPADALVAAQNFVAGQVSEGVELNRITEALILNENQRKHWENVSILQGTITAVPVEGEQTMVLLPLQEEKTITWVCSGTVPPAVQSLCGQ